jgi:hypothetical protein
MEGEYFPGIEGWIIRTNIQGGGAVSRSVSGGSNNPKQWYFSLPTPSITALNGVPIQHYAPSVEGDFRLTSAAFALGTERYSVPDTGIYVEIPLGFHSVIYNYGPDLPSVGIIVLDGSPVPEPSLWKPATWEFAQWHHQVPSVVDDPNVGEQDPFPVWNFANDIVIEDLGLFAEWSTPINVILLTKEPGGEGWDNYINAAGAERGWTWADNPNRYIINGEQAVIVTGYAGIADSGSSEKRLIIDPGAGGKAMVTLANAVIVAALGPPIGIVQGEIIRCCSVVTV